MMTRLEILSRVIIQEFKIREREKNNMASLKEKDLDLLNCQLRDLQQIRDDIKKAKEANVPGIDDLSQRCEDCMTRCTKLKEVYFPDKR